MPAQKNETHTLMEAVVYDISSRSLLFRAPGTSAVKAHATLAGNANERRADSQRGFDLAAHELTNTLATELESFKIRARQAPDTVKIEHRSGYTGGGSFNFLTVAALALFATASWFNRPRR